MPVVKIFAFLELEQNRTFFKDLTAKIWYCYFVFVLREQFSKQPIMWLGNQVNGICRGQTLGINTTFNIDVEKT